MSEEPTEFEKAEFDSIARELREDTYTPLEGASPLGQRARAFFIAAMLLDTQPEKAGLVFYSINNFHT